MTIEVKSLGDEVKRLESDFWVCGEELHKIINFFIQELDRGNSDGTDPLGIPMNAAWVMEYPDGTEKGDYMALDLGGTNLRVVMVHLLGDHKLVTTQAFYRLPENIRVVKDRNVLFDFMAECLGKFIAEHHPTGVPDNKCFPLGFTFSYPATQSKINSGVLQRWTKGFDIPNVEGHDVVPLLMEKINKRSLPIRVVALINDTCGTLVASRYIDPLTEMGCIFGTGVNGAYYDKVADIKKLQGKLPDDIPGDSPMLINCEYGSFDNGHHVIPRTKYDIEIDAQSPRPGQQNFEKMTSGYYLGELLRMILLEQYENGTLLQSASEKVIEDLKTPYFLDTSFLSYLESDNSKDLAQAKQVFADKLGMSNATFDDCQFAKTVASYIGTRAARLSICGISAVCKKMNYQNCHIAADGSVFMKYPHFPERAAQGLSDVFGWGDMKMEDHPIKIIKAHDGSGVGAAVIAALAHKREEKGLSLGLKDA